MNTKKAVLKYLIEVIVIVAFTLIMFTKIVKPMSVDGQSMAPNLYSGDLIVVSALNLNQEAIERFDVVVLDCEVLQKNIVKRVIGLPGETIVYHNDRLYIDGIYYQESFLDDEFINNAKLTYQSELFTNDFEITLGSDEIFVLGDNRLQSTDSRSLGTFGYDDIIAKNGIVLFPLKDMQFIE